MFTSIYFVISCAGARLEFMGLRNKVKVSPTVQQAEITGPKERWDGSHTKMRESGESPVVDVPPSLWHCTLTCLRQEAGKSGGVDGSGG